MFSSEFLYTVHMFRQLEGVKQNINILQYYYAPAFILMEVKFLLKIILTDTKKKGLTG